MTPEQLKELQGAIKLAVEETAPGAVATAVEEKTSELTESFKAIQDQFTKILEESKFTDTGAAAEKAEQVEVAGKIFRGLMDQNTVDENGEKTLTNNVDSTGGALLPTEFYNVLMQEVEKWGIARKYCRVIPMGANEKDIPSLTGSITAYIVGGWVAITPSNPTFETLTLKARKFAVLVHAWNELLDDNATNQDVFDLVVSLAGDAFAVLEDTQVFTGDGTGTNFEGIVTNTDVNVTTLTGTSINSITFDKLVDLVNSVLIRYKRGKKPIFVMSQLALGAIQKLKATDGMPILLKDLTAPMKYTLLGFPVEITDTFGQTDGADEDFIIFGDFKYYAMGDRKAATAETGYTDANFSKDIKSLRVITRVAGVMIFGAAFAKIKTAAA